MFLRGRRNRSSYTGSREAPRGQGQDHDGGDWAAGARLGSVISEAAGGQSDREQSSANQLIPGSTLHLGSVGLGTLAHFSDLASFHYVDSASPVSFLLYVYTHPF